jgi:hypothetical protein
MIGYYAYMEHEPPLGPTLPEQVFVQAAQHAGDVAVLRVLDDANKVKPPLRGVTATTPDQLASFTATPETISFRYGKWGPYVLGVDRARALLAPTDDEGPAIPAQRTPQD